jgi:glucose-6-phosphate dehydrogenase assembly protein OpcA
MAQTFKIQVRRIDDYEIEVNVVELARLLGVPTATVTSRLAETGSVAEGGCVLIDVLRTNGQRTRAEQIERERDRFLDAVTSVELHQPERVTWTKTDRVVDSVIVTA